MSTNIKELGEKILNAMKEERAAAPKIQELADYCKVFKVIDIGNIDEPMVLEVDGTEWYDEDGQGFVVCDDFYTPELAEKHGKRLEQQFGTILGWIEDLSDGEVPDDKIPMLKISTARSLNEARAALLMEINNAINEELFTRIENRINEIIKDYPGVFYDGWEEVRLEFTIDGERYSMWSWDGELEKWEPPKKLVEPEKKDE